ncbi:methyltransferase-like protein 25B [Anopheles maculipalpis]|uniref:methyltransferase-like protein 25B n=1 Tax=Anopheles maculipalpis TaxID=1496333 RepID=UPI0021592073|nr:methyltransferase-like protein 25B [Anopheles maculipalpis]
MRVVRLWQHNEKSTGRMCHTRGREKEEGCYMSGRDYIRLSDNKAMEECLRMQVELRHKINESSKIVHLYKTLIDAYIVDFFDQNHWNNLPPSWIRCFATIPIQQLPELLFFEGRKSEANVWPLSVLALRSLFWRLVHTRTKPAVKSHTKPTSYVYHKHSGLFKKSVKLKKRHEIEEFANDCSRESIENIGSTLVDIGSGQGNLARTLAYGYGFRVCCLEQNGSFVKVARQKDTELWRRLVKLEPALNGSIIHPVHLHEKVNLEHIDPGSFVQLLRDALNVEKEQQNEGFNFGLIGLHPCGDLAPSLLRLLLACQECRFVKLVCCCYMKLSCENSTTNGSFHEYGFPLSDFCRTAKLTLSYEAREIACHAIEQYRDKLKVDYRELKVHAYRAAIESIIVRLRPDLKHSGLKGGIKATETSFDEYCQRATDGLGIVIPKEAIQAEETQQNLARWEEVVKFYTLRLMFAPLIETIVLYDRLLFLLEKGAHARIDVLFDPYLSPRNHVITAYK